MSQSNPLGGQNTPPRSRSRPIAIRRSSREFSADASDENEEDDDGVIDVERDAIRIGARSLPSRLLLRAPFLGSVPSSSIRLSSNEMLPPAAASEQTTDTTTSYGSLRESNMRGRFWDGPSSYRDGRTGNIHRANVVRFQQDFDIPSLSIRERMQQTKQQSPPTSAPSSTLAAMLEQEPSAGKQSNKLLQNDQDVWDRPLYQQNDAVSSEHMLSTSLTSLEIMRGAFRAPNTRTSTTTTPTATSFSSPSTRTTKNSRVPSLDTLTEFPGDRHGNNSILSRSLSDPTPHLTQIPRPGFRESLPNSPYLSRQPEPTLTPNLNATPRERHDENPDVEGAFDMDM